MANALTGYGAGARHIADGALAVHALVHAENQMHLDDKAAHPQELDQSVPLQVDPGL